MGNEDERTDSRNIYCPECGAEIYQGENFCPRCGTEQHTTKPSAQSASLADRISLYFAPKWGFPFGVLGYFLGHVLIFGVALFDVAVRAPSTTATTSNPEPSPINALSWSFYSSHFVPIKVSTISQSASVNVIFRSNNTLPDLVYFMIPVVVLFIMGYITVRFDPLSDEDEDQDLLDAGIEGASIVSGYLLFCAISPFIFTGTFETTGSFGSTESVVVRPELASAILVAGVAYPIIFGGLGGYVARMRQKRKEL